MAGHGYEINVTFDRDVTAEFSVEMTVLGDEPAFPWAEYELSYRVGDASSPAATLAVDDGLTVTEADNLLTISMAPRRLCAGRYPHACLATHVTTGKVVPLFGGSITIAEDDF